MTRSTTNRLSRFGRASESGDDEVGPSPGELLAASYHEMLNGFRRNYDLTGDLSVKDVIERAEYALSLNS